MRAALSRLRPRAGLSGKGEAGLTLDMRAVLSRSRLRAELSGRPGRPELLCFVVRRGFLPHIMGGSLDAVGLHDNGC
jgi:hypothetical protein